MKFSDLCDNWPKLIALVLLTAALFWGFSCPAQVESLRTPGKKIGRAELQLELDQINNTVVVRMADLEKQEQFRDLIFKNALIMVEAGTLNPAGIIVLLTSLYGVTRATSDTVKKVKNRKKEI